MLANVFVAVCGMILTCQTAKIKCGVVSRIGVSLPVFQENSLKIKYHVCIATSKQKAL